jgi:ATP-binding cassette subfamily B protein
MANATSADAALKKIDPRTTKLTIGLFWRGVTRYPWLLWPLLVLVPITVVLGDFVQPYITAQVLSHLSTGNYNHNDLWASFGSLLIAYAIAVIGSGVILWRINIWLIWNLENNVTRDIHQRIFSHLLKMSPNFHANHFSGSLVSQANKLAGAYIRFADSTVFNLYTLVVSIAATIIILAPRAPLFVLVLLALSIAYVIGTMFFSGPVREANAIESNLQSRQTGYLADSMSNISAIKTFSAGDYERQRYLEIGTKVRAASRHSMVTTLKREGYASVINSAIGIAAIIIAVVGIGVLNANIATVFLVVTYTANIGHRLWEFQNVLRQYNRAFGDASDMVRILQIQPEIKDPARPEKLRVKAGAIRFEGVNFAHPEASDTLFKDFDLDIKAGEKVGLVGHSGSGKTTLTRLLLRFSDLDSGRITIDGQDISKMTQDDLRSVISYVPQEPLLFHRALRENIGYGRRDASQADIEWAAKQAHAAEFIAKLPHGYDTLVGERGIKLSGGQRQRIAIARAMVKNAPVLVLDEATSALDSESEKLIQDALWKLMEGRTAIAIAHRLSTIQRMDRIIVLDDGRVAEQGTHAELLAKGGIYAQLWSHQSGGFMED